MKMLFQAVPLLFALLSTAAQANTYSFSFTFNIGIVVSGQFDGTPIDGLVTDLSNPSVFVDGVQKSGHLEIAGEVSSNGKRNNFYVGAGPDFVFQFYAGGAYPDYLSMVNLYDSSLDPKYQVIPDYYLLTQMYDNGNNWQLRDINAVPEPETYAMLVAGLGLVGAVTLRRKQL
ncbi:hypothetical protein FHW58_001054 [Duganella sp. 1224]|nr:PEP-CTERM sorting domain-containing protein [Duganella sp. 1224]NYE59902.1 hypothetical protein [Duganella sp. 1224]